MADRWAQADPTHRFWVVLKVFSGYTSYASQPAGWHQYAPAVAEDNQAPYSYSISPGFYKKGEAAPRLARDPGPVGNECQSSRRLEGAVAAGDDVE